MPYRKHVLFLCTGNSARSIMAEAILNHRGGRNFRASSGGSRPAGEVHPYALRVLRENDVPALGLASKDWEVFTAPEAANVDFVITVCDDAAGEVCPVWPGHPGHAHWSIGDPVKAKGKEADQLDAFREAYCLLDRHIRQFLAAPFLAANTDERGAHAEYISREYS